jgi:glycopeptide antibiotics resistance protein
MPSTTYVPAAPVIVAFLVLALAVTVWRLHERSGGRMTAPQVVTGLVTCAYGACVLKEVLLPLQVSLGAAGNQVPWWVLVQPIPLVTADPTGLILNLLLFLPLGILLPFVLPAPTLRRVVLTGFALSLTIETVQFVTDVLVSSGRVADVDDLIANTVGTLVGFALFRLAIAVPALARLAAAATWPAAPAGVPTVGVGNGQLDDHARALAASGNPPRS